MFVLYSILFYSLKLILLVGLNRSITVYLGVASDVRFVLGLLLKTRRYGCVLFSYHRANFEERHGVG